MAAAAPFSTEAVCSSFSIGSDGAAAASLAAGGRLFLHGDLEARLFRHHGRENRAGGEARHQQNKAGAENGTENFIEFEGVHFRIRLQAGRSTVRPAGTAADEHQESGFRTAPAATMRYRFARALATRINAPTFDQSPSFPACYQPGPDLIPMTETRTLVLIPARMAATRLPGKPLLDIAGLPMIVHVLRRAEAAQIGRVAVATDTPEIAAAVTAHGGEAVMTRADHPSGSDRIYEALGKLDPDGEAEIVVNLQGDFPTIRPTTSATCWRRLPTPRSISRRWPPKSIPRKRTPTRTW